MFSFKKYYKLPLKKKHTEHQLFQGDKKKRLSPFLFVQKNNKNEISFFYLIKIRNLLGKMGNTLLPQVKYYLNMFPLPLFEEHYKLVLDN